MTVLVLDSSLAQQIINANETASEVQTVEDLWSGLINDGWGLIEI